MTKMEQQVEKDAGRLNGHVARALTVQSERALCAHRPLWAHHSSERAARMFRLGGDTGGEARALAIAAQAAIAMGRNEDAVEAALLAVHLAQGRPGTRLLARSHISLGLAYLWSHSFERARDVLGRAHAAANRAGLISVAAQAALGLLWADVLQAAMVRYSAGGVTEVPPGQSRVRQAHRPVGATTTLAGMHLKSPAEFVAWRVALVLQKCWAANPDDAHCEWAALGPWLDHSAGDTPMAALACWAAAEMALCRGRYDDAGHAAARMTQVSVACEQEQLLWMGHLLAGHIAASSGRQYEALEELRKLSRRQLASRAAASRSDRWVLRMRQEVLRREALIRAMKADVCVHERNSLEDCLTGLLNRRALERTLRCALQQCPDRGMPLSLALLDVDRFKIINDRFTHQAGDLALKVVAQVLKQCIREQDAAFRMGGDEFVIVFVGADRQAATEVCERIAHGMRDFDWLSIGIGLTVSVTSGVAQAQEGESVESLLHRADRNMYVLKKAGSLSCGGSADLRLAGQIDERR